MVAHLLGLKWQLLLNSVRRSAAVLVGMVLGLLYGGGLLLFAVGGLIGLRFQPDLDLARAVLVIGGSALVVAWTVVPVLIYGTDPTLEPSRFATFAVPDRQLAAGLLLSGFVGLPGAATLLLGLSSLVTSSRSLWAVLVALPATVAAVLSCVLLSRITTSAASALLQSRKGRDVMAAAGFVAVLAVGPALAIGSGGGATSDQVERAVGVLAWLPMGWGWAAAADAAQGQWASSLVRLLLALASCAVLFLLWERQLVSALRNPRTVVSGSHEQTGLGLFGRLPGTPLGAVAARTATYWRRDPRFNFPALVSVLLPAGLLIPWTLSQSETALLGMPLACGYLWGWGQHNDVGYDSTPFWMHVATGVDGVSDRLGRLLPSAALATVLVPTYAVLAAGLGHRWDLLPALLGAGFALALSGFGVSSVVSAVRQYPVPPPGSSPFATPPGHAGLTITVQTVCGLAVLLLSGPALVLALLARAGYSWAGWAALVVGLLLGSGVFAAGVVVGARLFERRGPELLQDLVRQR